tara:strand:+ start:10478 stop:11815 length:1338 start_codon:yes stop_codon:yes gene_type:complete
MQLTREMLHNYQERGVDFVVNTKKCALWLDMGLGKTLTSLTAIVDLIDSFDITKVLIIAPLRVANTTWHKEIENWEHTKHLTYSIVTGSDKKRRAALYKSADVYIINRENIKWLVDLYGDKWPFDMVVIDESSSFKSSKSQRWKSLRKIMPYVDRLVELTGTPTSNGLLDLFAQVYLLDIGQRLGRTMTAYKARFFESDYMGFKYTPRDGSKDIIYKLIEDVVMTMRAEDYLELPARMDITIPVQISAKLKAQYDELENEFMAEIEDVSVAVFNAAALANKLLQFCNGAVYIDEHKNWVELHKEKLDALSDIIEDNQGENILVAYNYKTDLERLVKKFPDAVVMDKEGLAVQQWNDGEIKMLLAHPASAGHGLNLQAGGNIIVWFGLNWSLELYQQFNGRLHRQGQTKPVKIIHLVVEGCIDEKVISAIGDKAETQNDLLEALKV